MCEVQEHSIFYGCSGSGKTMLIKRFLVKKDMKYKVVEEFAYTTLRRLIETAQK